MSSNTDALRARILEHLEREAAEALRAASDSHDYRTISAHYAGQIDRVAIDLNTEAALVATAQRLGLGPARKPMTVSFRYVEVVAPNDLQPASVIEGGAEPLRIDLRVREFLTRVPPSTPWVERDLGRSASHTYWITSVLYAPELLGHRVLFERTCKRIGVSVAASWLASHH